MRYNTAYTFRFYPTAEQKAALAEVFGHTRYVWNWALDLRTESYYDEGKSLSYTDTSKRLTKHKQEKEWLRNVSSVALQQKLRDLEQAFQNFFDGRTGYPNFKRKHGKQAARFASNAFTLYGKRLSMAKVPGELNVRWSRDLSDSCNVTGVTLTKDPAGRYFVSLTCTEEKEPLPETDKTVGVDLGITDLVVTSGGFKSGNPKHLDNDLYRLKKAQRRLSRKKKGSQNWKKQKRRVARLHAKIADKRNDFLHKLSRKLVDENQTICLETLNVKGMQRREASAAPVQNRSLSRSIADTGWATLVQYIEYKAEWAGRTVVKIDRWFPSTKRCSECGHVGETKPLSVRRWQCKECGEHHDRDVNAAKNIRTVGLAGAADAANDSGGHSKTRDAFVLNAHGPSKE
jgi:putative transposase